VRQDQILKEKQQPKTTELPTGSADTHSVAGIMASAAVPKAVCESDEADEEYDDMLLGELPKFARNALLEEDDDWCPVEPTYGCYWDWPLSREEKKERCWKLEQMDLLEEIEALRCDLEDKDREPEEQQVL